MHAELRRDRVDERALVALESRMAEAHWPPADADDALAHD
jgi:hypothetical protein